MTESCFANGGRFGLVTVRCVPFSAIDDRLSDSNGSPLFEKSTAQEVLEDLSWAASEHLVEATTLWDDALFSWSPDQESCALTPQETAQAEKLRDFLSAAHIRLLSFGCDLSCHPVFRDGALTSHTPEIPRLARRKLERAFALAKLLNAESFELDLSREGWETPYNIDWSHVHRRLTHSLNALAEYAAHSQDSSIRSLNIVSGNTALRRHSFLANPGETAAFLATLPSIFPWKINPYCARDISLSLLTFLAQHDLLGCYPLGGGPAGATCATNLLDTVQQLATLQSIGWHGPVVFRSRMLRSESDPENCSTSRRQFISNASASLTIAANFVQRLQGNWTNELTTTETELMALTQLANLSADEILMQTITPVREDHHLSIDELASRYDQNPLPGNAGAGRNDTAPRPSWTKATQPQNAAPVPRFPKESAPMPQNAPQPHRMAVGNPVQPQNAAPVPRFPKESAPMPQNAPQPHRMAEGNPVTKEREQPSPKAFSAPAAPPAHQEAGGSENAKQLARERRRELRRERLAAKMATRQLAWQGRHELPLPVQDNAPHSTLPLPSLVRPQPISEATPGTPPDKPQPTASEEATPPSRPADSEVKSSTPDSGMPPAIADVQQPANDAPCTPAEPAQESLPPELQEVAALPQSEQPHSNPPEQNDAPIAAATEESLNETVTPFAENASPVPAAEPGDAPQSTGTDEEPPGYADQAEQLPLLFPELANDQPAPVSPATEAPQDSPAPAMPFLPANAQVNAGNSQGRLPVQSRRTDNRRELKHGRPGRKGRNGPPKTFRKP
ncbi:MAG: hypothetical protein IJJ33_11245 [Victivallales bacterium]|nr:hypothetical protein [Victivallales bacterium]